MNKNEQDMIRKIKEKSEQVPVPKALEPRQIEAKLAGKKKKVWTPARIGGLAAACLVLIVGVMVCQNYFKMEDATRDDKIAVWFPQFLLLDYLYRLLYIDSGK